MEKFEQPSQKESISLEESGVRRIPAGLSDEELNRRLDAKKHEVHPEDPWEEFGPKDEPNTAKVWGEGEDLDAEDRKHYRELAKRMADMDELDKPTEEKKAS
jgi:hypothetical protein